MCIFGDEADSVMRIQGPRTMREIRTLLKEDYLGNAVIGWRSWHIGYAGELQGSYGGIWKPGEIMHSGTYFRKKVPYPILLTGRTGIYAYKNENPFDSHKPLWGEVLLWGQIASYRRGYRAQFAYPLSFFAKARRAEYFRPWAENGVYINVYSPSTKGADEKGYIQYA